MLENKRTDGVTVNEKKRIWEVISNEYNSSASTGDRSGEQLKMLYNNMKRTAKKAVAEEHVRIILNFIRKFVINVMIYFRKRHIWKPNKCGPRIE